MILHHNNIIRLDYDPATDILQVDYPDLKSFHLSEIRYSFGLMVETIRNYDVKKLLLDAKQTEVEVSDEVNRQISMELAADLAKTRLTKVARINPANVVRESKAQENIRAMQKAGLLSYELQTFVSRAEALAWLQV